MTRTKSISRILLPALLLTATLAAAPAHAALFGESDEEKAARLAHENGQDSDIQQALARITALEDKVRNLQDSLARATSTSETLSHRLDETTAQTARQLRDYDYRICTLSAQLLGGGGGDAPPVNCNAPQSAAPSPAQSFSVPQTGSFGARAELPPLSGPSLSSSGPAPLVLTPPPARGNNLAPPPGVLGSLPANGARTASAAPSAAPASSSASNQRSFDAAMNLLARAQYDEAAAGFRAFADRNPDDDLTPQAVYWVGQIAFVRQDYQNAARAFAEGVKNYPKSTRAPDSMLKLGQSLIALGQKTEGCTTLGALKTRYPKAAPAVLTQGDTARRAAACRA